MGGVMDASAPGAPDGTLKAKEADDGSAIRRAEWSNCVGARSGPGNHVRFSRICSGPYREGPSQRPRCPAPLPAPEAEHFVCVRSVRRSRGVCWRCHVRLPGLPASSKVHVPGGTRAGDRTESPLVPRFLPPQHGEFLRRKGIEAPAPAAGRELRGHGLGPHGDHLQGFELQLCGLDRHGAQNPEVRLHSTGRPPPPGLISGRRSEVDSPGSSQAEGEVLAGDRGSSGPGTVEQDVCLASPRLARVSCSVRACYTSRQAFHTNPPNRQHLHRPGLTNRVVVRLRGFFLHDP